MTKKDRDERNAYRAVFLDTPEGRSVLAHILTTLGYFNTVDNETERVQRNVGVWVLSMLGVTEMSNINYFISQLVRIPIEETVNGQKI